MTSIMGRNVNEVYSSALRMVENSTTRWPSRNGDMIEFRGAVMSRVFKPHERVLFDPVRDANPFFHFFEGLWMIAGREDLEFPQFFVSNFGQFSDDGKTLNGAYGHRWRTKFGEDHILDAIEHLERDPLSRRVVIPMWNSAGEDMQSKDVPCNTHIYLSCRGGDLSMTVCCRSNDLILGAYGANIVHFSMLQEYMAGKLGKMMGSLTQLSNSLHIYPDHKAAARILAAGPASDVNHYHSLKPLRLKSDTPGWDKKLENFFEVFDEHGPTEFLQLEEPGSFWEAAFTYWNAWLHYKHSPKDGLEYLQEVSDANLELRLKDWTFAMLEWLKRRVK